MSFIDDLRYSFIPRYGAVAWLILLNVGFYLLSGFAYVVAWAIGSEQAFIKGLLEWVALPADVLKLATHPWTLVSYMFVHLPLALFHILFNMLWLYWLGALYRTYLKDAGVYHTYVLGGIVGGVLYVLVYNLVPRLAGAVPLTTLNGASAGVLAVVVGCATLLPNYSIHLMFFGAVRLKWLALVMVILDLLSVAGSNTGGVVAHLGGAALGFAYIKAYYAGVNLGAPLAAIANVVVGAFERISQKGSTNRRRTKPVQPNPQMTVIHRRQPGRQPGAKPSQQEIDRILDKIAAEGYDKLTPEEKQALLSAGTE